MVRLLHGMLDSEVDMRILSLSLHAPHTASLTHLSLSRPYLSPRSSSRSSGAVLLYVPVLRVPWACTLAQLLDIHLNVTLQPVPSHEHTDHLLPLDVNANDLYPYDKLPKYARAHNDQVLATLSPVHMQYVALCAKIAFLNSVRAQVAAAAHDTMATLNDPRFKHCSSSRARTPQEAKTQTVPVAATNKYKRRCQAKFILYGKALPCSSSPAKINGVNHNSSNRNSRRSNTSNNNSNINSNSNSRYRSSSCSNRNRNSSISISSCSSSNNNNKVLINGFVIHDDILRLVNDILNYRYNIEIKLTNAQSSSTCSPSRSSHHYIGSISSLSNLGSALYNNVTYHNLHVSPSSPPPSMRNVNYQHLYCRSSSAAAQSQPASTSVDTYVYETFGVSWKSLLNSVVKQAEQLLYHKQHQNLNHLNQTVAQIVALRDTLVHDVVQLHMVGESLASISAMTIIKENLVDRIESASRQVYVQFIEDVSKRIRILQQKDCKQANQLALNYYQKSIEY